MPEVVQGSVVVLVHSPIVGADTWGPVADALRGWERSVLVPDVARGGPEFWGPQVQSVVDHVRQARQQGPVVLVAHSGAGQLLPHIGTGLRAAGLEVGAYVLVDAGLPTDGSSRLEQLRTEAPDLARELGDLLASDRTFPNWVDEDLTPLVRDPRRRRRLLDGLRPLPEAYWTEPIPAVVGWPDAPCGVLLLSDGYSATARRARDEGWVLVDLHAGNHFHMLADPDGVARALGEIVDGLHRA